MSVKKSSLVVESTQKDPNGSGPDRREFLPDGLGSALADVSPAIMVALDCNSRVVYANAAALRYRNTTFKKVAGELWADAALLPSAVDPMLLRHHQLVNKTGAPSSFRAFIPTSMGGFTTDFTLTPVREPTTDELVVLITGRDISEYHTAHEQLAGLATFGQSFLDSVPMELVALDQTGKIVSTNRTWLDFADSVGAKIPESARVGGNYLDALRRALDTGNEYAVVALNSIESVLSRKLPHFSFEYVCESPNGPMWYLMRVSPMHGQAAGVVVAHVDISDRKRVEDQVNQQNQYLAALHELTLSLLKSQDLHDILETIIIKACELFKVDSGYISLIDEAHGVFVQQVGYGSEAVDNGMDHPLDAGLSGRAYRTKSIAIVDDYQTWPERWHHASTARAAAAIPLIDGNKVIGVIALGFNDDHRKITSDMVPPLVQFGRLAELALQNAQLFREAQLEITERQSAEDRLRQQNEYLTTLQEVTPGLIAQLDLDQLLETIISRAAALAGSSHGYVAIIDTASNKMIQRVGVGRGKDYIGYEYPKGGGLVGRVWQSGEAKVINRYDTWKGRLEEFSWIKSAVAVPLINDGVVIGVIGLSYDVPNKQFTDEQVTLLEQISQLASLALHNASLFEQAQRDLANRIRAEGAERELRLFAETLRETASALNSSLHLDNVLDLILENVEKILPGSLSNVMLLDDQAVAHVRRVRGYKRLSGGFNPLGAEFSMKDSPILQQMALSGKPVIVQDAHELTNLVDFRKPDAGQPRRSYLGIPIQIDEQVIGFLNVDYLKPNQFSVADAQRLTAFGDQCGLAIKNARLYEQAAAGAVLEERQRLAREMHDTISQMLFSASLVAGTLPKLLEKDPQSVSNGLHDLERMTLGALGEMRVMLTTLRPGALGSADLPELLRQMSNALAAHTQSELEFDVIGDDRLPPEVQTAFYWVMREAMENVKKHARPTRIAVKLTTCPDRGEVSITDNGIGFNPRKLSGGHFGIGIMQERASEVGAELIVSSRKSKGTTIQLIWPANADEKAQASNRGSPD